jgi:hypothetical protein
VSSPGDRISPYYTLALLGLPELKDMVTPSGFKSCHCMNQSTDCEQDH